MKSQLASRHPNEDKVAALAIATPRATKTGAAVRPYGKRGPPRYPGDKLDQALDRDQNRALFDLPSERCHLYSFGPGSGMPSASWEQ